MHGTLCIGIPRNSPGWSRFVCFPTLSEVMRRVSPFGMMSGDLLNARKWSDQIRILEVTSVYLFDQVRAFATK